MEATLLFQVAQNYNRKLRFLKQVWAGPQSSRRYRIPKFLDSRHMKGQRQPYAPAAFASQEITLALISVSG